MSRHALVVRQDSMGDVLLAGPAVRAVAAGASRVTLLVGPTGRTAADLLPGVDKVVTWPAPWIEPAPGPVSAADVDAFVDEIARQSVEQALILTSFHQSPLPLALLLRLARVPVIAAISPDYPGSLLDVRHRVADDIHEVERGLSLVGALGYRLPRGDDGRLAVRWRARDGGLPDRLPASYVVLHPGASVPARTWPPERSAELAAALAGRGWAVVVTGGPAERALTARVSAAAGQHGIDLGGRLNLAGLAGVLAGAGAVVVGNTGPAHLAAAVGTPVVSLFAPVVPAVRWRPWGVPHVLLGDQEAACEGSRARTCPIPGHPCLAGVGAGEALAAVEALVGRHRTGVLGILDDRAERGAMPV